MESEKNGPRRTLVIPGELLSEGKLKAGKHTFLRNNKIYASQMGFKTVTANYVNVIPLSGRYIPRPDDLVVGIITSVSPTTWLVEINSPYPAPLHVTEAPWRVDFGDTSRYMNTGDTILARIFMVDENKKVQVTMKDQGSRKLIGGQVIEISPSKVPRVIGKGGSMISLIKQKTMCRLFVGQNGRIWIDGEPEKISMAVNAIRFIERESHRYGLTESVEKYLNKELFGKDSDDTIEPEIVVHKKAKDGIPSTEHVAEKTPEEDESTHEAKEVETDNLLGKPEAGDSIVDEAHVDTKREGSGKVDTGTQPEVGTRGPIETGTTTGIEGITPVQEKTIPLESQTTTESSVPNPEDTPMTKIGFQPPPLNIKEPLKQPEISKPSIPGGVGLEQYGTAFSKDEKEEMKSKNVLKDEDFERMSD